MVLMPPTDAPEAIIPKDARKPKRKTDRKETGIRISAKDGLSRPKSMYGGGKEIQYRRQASGEQESLKQKRVLVGVSGKWARVRSVQSALWTGGAPS